MSVLQGMKGERPTIGAQRGADVIITDTTIIATQTLEMLQYYGVDNIGGDDERDK